MSIYLIKNNQRLGPFDDSAVADLLRSGAVQPEDLAWRDGMSTWEPLHLVSYPTQSQPLRPNPSVTKSRAPFGATLLASFLGLTVLGCIGAAVGGFLGFSMRPAAPLVGQLPFGVVVTRGAYLTGLDSLLVGVAQTSFNYLMAGVIVGGVVGGVCGVFGGPLLVSLFSRR